MAHIEQKSDVVQNESPGDLAGNEEVVGENHDTENHDTGRQPIRNYWDYPSSVRLLPRREWSFGRVLNLLRPRIDVGLSWQRATSNLVGQDGQNDVASREMFSATSLAMPFMNIGGGFEANTWAAEVPYDWLTAGRVYLDADYTKNYPLKLTGGQTSDQGWHLSGGASATASFEKLEIETQADVSSRWMERAESTRPFPDSQLLQYRAEVGVGIRPDPLPLKEDSDAPVIGDAEIIKQEYKTPSRFMATLEYEGNELSHNGPYQSGFTGDRLHLGGELRLFLNSTDGVTLDGSFISAGKQTFTRDHLIQTGSVQGFDMEAMVHGGERDYRWAVGLEFGQEHVEGAIGQGEFGARVLIEKDDGGRFDFEVKTAVPDQHGASLSPIYNIRRPFWARVALSLPEKALGRFYGLGVALTAARYQDVVWSEQLAEAGINDTSEVWQFGLTLFSRFGFEGGEERPDIFDRGGLGLAF